MKRFIFGGIAAIAMAFVAMLSAADQSQAATVVVKNLQVIDISPTTIIVRAADLTTYSFAFTSKTLVKEKTGAVLPKAQITAGDKVSVWADKLTTGAKALKIVDYSTWKTSVTGKITSQDNDRLTFTQNIPSTIKELSKTLYYEINVEVLEDTTAIRQVEVKRVRSSVTRTTKIRTWANLENAQTVVTTGYYHSISNMLTATRIQLPSYTAAQ